MSVMMHPDIETAMVALTRALGVIALRVGALPLSEDDRLLIAKSILSSTGGVVPMTAERIPARELGGIMLLVEQLVEACKPADIDDPAIEHVRLQLRQQLGRILGCDPFADYDDQNGQEPRMSG